VAFKPWQVRFILRRDRFVCYVCGLEGADQADHVIPIAEGGANHTENGRAIHAEPCHATKSRQEAARGYARHRAKATLKPEPNLFDVQET
jgi:5-methylcytosine-specific restriction endonuclease McrA